MIYRYVPSLTALRTFESSARHMSFTKAAEELNLTQSAVSRQVRNLEDFVETDLFQRIKKRLILTEEGETYAASITQHLNAIEQDTLLLLTKDLNDTRLNVGTFQPLGHVGLFRNWMISRKKIQTFSLILSPGSNPLILSIKMLISQFNMVMVTGPALKLKKL